MLQIIWVIFIHMFYLQEVLLITHKYQKSSDTRILFLEHKKLWLLLKLIDAFDYLISLNSYVELDLLNFYLTFSCAHPL